MSNEIPLVDYLVLGDEPHLEANECTSCGARFFDRRNACAELQRHRVPQGGRRAPPASCGRSRSCRFAAPGVPVPFVAGVIDCDGTSVRGNVVNVEPDAEHVTLGMKVRLTTYPIGTDEAGTEAIGFGFEPIS